LQRKAWAEKHQAAVVGMGGPLGKTKSCSKGIGTLQSVPGESVEIMPVLPIPGA
jgi:hypothetical protein